MESHQRDHENYVACSRSHRRRAKALLDFERHDDDELGFRKNDIITVRGALRCVGWLLGVDASGPATCWPRGCSQVIQLTRALPLLSVSLLDLAKDENR